MTRSIVQSRKFAEAFIKCDAHYRRQLRNGVLCAVTNESILLAFGSQPREGPITNAFKLIVIVTIAACIVSPVLPQLLDSGRTAFDMVTSNSTFSDRALIGGGSAGYNAELPERTD